MVLFVLKYYYEKNFKEPLDTFKKFYHFTSFILYNCSYSTAYRKGYYGRKLQKKRSFPRGYINQEI